MSPYEPPYPRMIDHHHGGQDQSVPSLCIPHSNVRKDCSARRVTDVNGGLRKVEQSTIPKLSAWTPTHSSISRSNSQPGPAPFKKGVRHEAGGAGALWEGPSCQTVTKIFDRRRQDVTAAVVRVRASPGNRATAVRG